MYIYQLKEKNNIKCLSKVLVAGTDSMQLGIDPSILLNSAGKISPGFDLRMMVEVTKISHRSSDDLNSDMIKSESDHSHTH